MKRFFLSFTLGLVLCALAPAQETDKCYRLGGLKNEEGVEFKITGRKVSGEYTIKRDYDDANIERYAFTGTVKGNIVTVKFSGKKPDSLPAKAASYAWTMMTAPVREYLRVQYYGKNYDTNKYANYFGELDSCQPVYGFLAKTPKAVQFVKGQNSASMQVTFPDNKGYRTFLIGARKGQSLEISAPGCAIRVYLPDKKLYEYLENGGGKAGVGLDMMALSPLPQTGNYLVALQIAGDDLSPRKISFKITE